jgi:peptidoglycan-N-acetylglucosamine deacetylase
MFSNLRRRLTPSVSLLRAAFCPAPRIVKETKHTSGKWVALTFDDGPHPEYTSQILDILKRFQVHATFCLVGEMVSKSPDLVRRIVADGHRIANHSMTHSQELPTMPRALVTWEIAGTLDEIHKAAPEAEVWYYRAPYGDFTTRVNRIASSFGLAPLGWSVDTRDWSKPGVDAIIDAVEQQLKPGGVILMHDAGCDRSQTVAAVEKLVPKLIAQGYKFDFPSTR